MSKLDEIRGPHVARTYIGPQGTAGSTDAWPAFRAPGDIKITGVTWIPAADVTGDDTDNFALAAQNKGADGEGTTAVTATKTYATGVDSNAHEAEELTLSSTDADLLVDEGEVVALVRTVNGTGLASPDGVLEVTYQYA